MTKPNRAVMYWPLGGFLLFSWVSSTAVPELKFVHGNNWDRADILLSLGENTERLYFDQPLHSLTLKIHLVSRGLMARSSTSIQTLWKSHELLTIGEKLTHNRRCDFRRETNRAS